MKIRSLIRAALLLAATTNAFAATYTLPVGRDTVIGEVQKVVAAHEDTLLDIGRRYGVGYEEIVAANPGVNAWVPGAGTEVLIPSRYILPDGPREGVVVSLSEHRLFYFPPHKPGEAAVVRTYPISVGRMDWHTPLGLTRIVNKREKPIWYPPESVRAEHAADGRPLPKAVPPGPDNPLGEYAMRLGIPGGAYLIHGTNRPSGVGMQVTHGCVRMFPEDIKELYGLVPVNTPVRLIDQPYKMGWRGDELFMEVHTPLEGTDSADSHSLTNITKLLVAATQERPEIVSSGVIDWAKAERTFASASGIPEPVMLHPASVPSTVQVINDTAGR
ncbi:L,D-transpeptidase family protein [Steroidobacter flavus]|uniref:L,D-transpeptidase family protein n=1 Tax=Steroidobacter flavus TaxID=1842136 RepID=A0ABV8T0G2_9GAMM